MSPRWMMDPEFEIDGFEYYNSDDEEDTYDPNTAKKRGQGPKINVRKSKW